MKTIIVVLAILGLGLAKPSPRDLDDDLQDFLDVIPWDDLSAILDDHLANDGAVADVVLYLQSDAWKTLVDEVGDKQAVQDFIAYLTEAGIDVDGILNTIDDLIASLKPTADPDTSASLKPFLDEVVAAIPVGDLLSLLNDKLQNSKAFQDLYTEISSEDAHKLVLEVGDIDEVQRLLQQLRDFDVPVDDIIDIIFGFLGWPSP